MPITAGDFGPSQLATTIRKADAMFSDDMMKADFEGNVETWKAINAEQNADVTLLQDREKTYDVKVVWVNSCGNTVADADGDDCDLSGAELGTDSKSYALTFKKQYKFSVNEMDFRTNTFNMEDVVAKGFLKGDKALSEAINASGVARLESFKGVNTVTDGIGTVNVATTETDVAAADFNERMFAYLYRVGIQNFMPNPFILSGGNLFEDRLISMLAEANAEGKGAAQLFKLIRTYFDLFGIDPANSPDLKTYLINRGAIAFASKVNYGAQPKFYKGAGQTRYSIPSRNLPGVRFDVFQTDRCVGDEIVFDFKMQANYDYLLNPTGCDGTRTGVLAFNKV